MSFLLRLIFSDEATFYLSGHVNCHIIRIWGSEQPHVTKEHETNSPKVNIWCGFMHGRIISPFFLAVKTVTMSEYVEMLE
jgi:hypothetical protein